MDMHDCKKYMYNKGIFDFVDQIITIVTITAASWCQKKQIVTILADTVTVMCEFLQHVRFAVEEKQE